MRPLIVVCDSKHLSSIQRGIERFAHPFIKDSFIDLLPIDTEGSINVDQVHRDLLNSILKDRSGAFGVALVAFTDPVGRLFGLSKFLNGRTTDFSKISTNEIAKLDNPQIKDGQFKTLLNRCGLSIHGAATEILSKWTHSTVDLKLITRWQNQFFDLSKEHGWIAEFLLRETVFVNPVDLGDALISLNISENAAACYNKDSRGTVKSGEILANLLTKRIPSIKIYDAPATIIDGQTHQSVVIFEDGLWTGTEAVGVMDSLLGRRKGREKTAPLVNPDKLKDFSVEFAYAVGTDYGQALIQRYARDNDLKNVGVWCGKTVSIAAPGTMEIIQNTSENISDLFESGPRAGMVTPHLIKKAEQSLSPEKLDQLRNFFGVIGRQLFDNYLTRQVRDSNWTMWSEEKRQKSSLGKDNFCLSHAFAHSVPKATLPLFWSYGNVTFNGRSVDWRPLFENA